jgi:membrane associated rhomboid family serine protease
LQLAGLRFGTSLRLPNSHAPTAGCATIESVIIPIGHDQSIRRMPWVTITIISLCTLVHLYAAFGAPSEAQLERELLELELRDVGEPHDGEPPTAEEIAAREQEQQAILNKLPAFRWGYMTGSGLSLGLITSAFVHGDWFHLIGNMLFLWLAGSALEDRYGRLRFSLFYLVGAVAATFAYEVTLTGEPRLLIGASGAISACMGAFLVHFRKTQITFWYLIMYRSGTFRWPAWFALPLWLTEQVFYAWLHSSMGAVSGIAYAAHIGGFGAGLLGGFAMSKLFPRDAEHDDVEYELPAQPSAPRADPQLDDRIAKALAAIKARDAASTRQLASRAIIDLARIEQDRRILELYAEIAQHFTKVPLTDGAFAAAATSADRLNDRRTYVAIAGSLIEEHPGSMQLPKVMWRLSQLHREAGEYELEQETLRTLATKYPRDPLGQKAQLGLDRQS